MHCTLVAKCMLYLGCKVHAAWRTSLWLGVHLGRQCIAFEAMRACLLKRMMYHNTHTGVLGLLPIVDIYVLTTGL